MGRHRSYAADITFGILITLAVVALIVLVWLNGHLQYKELSKAAIAVTPTSITTVFLNAQLGNDANSGASDTSPVQTMSRAIEVLAESRGGTAVIQMGGNVALDLGANPTLNFGNIIGRYTNIIIQGERQAIVQDTVSNITVVNPLSTAWYQIMGTLGGYVPNAYEKHFISNDDMGRTYVVESNTGDTINTISGTSGVAASQDLPALIVDSVPWKLGERFTLFTVGATVITWTGQLSLDIPYNVVTFSYIAMQPTVAGSRVRAPDGSNHRVVFEACVMTLQSSSSTLPSFMGSMLMRGIYATGAVPNAALTGLQRNRCLMTESLWVDNDTSLVYSGSCYAIWIKSTNFNGAFAFTVSTAAQFYGIGIEITGHSLSGLIVNSASILQIAGVRIVRNVGLTQTPYQIVADIETQSIFSNINIECIPQTLCRSGVQIQEGNKARLGGHVRIIANQLIDIAAHGALDFYAISSLTGPSVFGGPPIVVGQGGFLSFAPVNVISISTVGTAFPVISVSRGRVDFVGAANLFQFSTNSGVPLVSAGRGSIVTASNGIGVNGMNVSNFNYGPTSTDIIKCGANAISAWTVTETDFNAVGTQACICAR